MSFLGQILGRKTRVQVATILVTFFVASTSFAQGTSEEKPKSGPRRQLATIVFMGLGGAVLGLSTLSFYGRPQDHLSNIAIGFAVGVITGVVVVTYSVASKPNYYSDYKIPTNQASRNIEFEKGFGVSAPVLSYTF